MLDQWIPLEPGRTFRIDYRYSAGGDDGSASPISGLAWYVEDPAAHRLLVRSEDLKAGTGELSGHMEFETGAAAAAVLSLRYQREPGTVRHAEKLTLQGVSASLESGPEFVKSPR